MHPLSDPKSQSFLPVSEQSDFPLQNIPFGVIERPDELFVCASRIGDTALDLNALQQLGYFDDLELPEGLFGQEALNDFISLGARFGVRFAAELPNSTQPDLTSRAKRANARKLNGPLPR